MNNGIFNIRRKTGGPVPERAQLLPKLRPLSGVSSSFLNIPPGVRKFKVPIKALSTNGTSRVIAQLGTKYGLETTGYEGSTQAIGVTGTAWTTGIVLAQSPVAAGAYTGSLTGELVDEVTRLWVFEIGVAEYAAGPIVFYGFGGKALAAPLTGILLTMQNGTDTFDGGSANVLYGY